MTALLGTSLGLVPPLDDKTFDQLLDALERERAAHVALALEREATVAELTGQMDVDSLLERELALASVVRARAAIDEINAALVRLDNGSYGSCHSCGDQLPSERLEVMPHARLCVSCPPSI